MRTIIAGSRTVTDKSIVYQAIAQSNFKITMVYSGRSSGVDALGEDWAKHHNVCVKYFPAEWNRYGKMAGPLRNQSMVNRAEALIAVWDGKSRGTHDVINRARAKGIPTFIYPVNPGVLEKAPDYGRGPHVNQHTDAPAKPSEVLPSNGLLPQEQARPGESSHFPVAAPERHSGDCQLATSQRSSLP